MIFVSFVVCRDLHGLGRTAAQSEITDPDLEQASAGRIVSIRAISGGRVATMPIEVYVARVVAGEGEPGAPEATQQALAIAVRTYATFNQGRHRRDGFDLCDSTHCQVLRASTAASRRAAFSTAGRILTYHGAPAEVFYSASCGGRSEAASAVWPAATLPYSRSAEDDVHDDDPAWRLDLPFSAIETVLRRNGFEGVLKNVEVAARTGSGRVGRLRLPGMRPDVITGEQFRTLMGAVEVRSTAFDVEKRGRGVRLTGRGFGHGVGMCVIGAGRRARRGESVEAILAQYYPGLTVSTGSAPAPPTRIPITVPPAGGEFHTLARSVQETLSTALGVSVAPATIQVHDTIDSFRAATGRPWWASAAINGTTIDLAPPAVLAQRDGVEATMRMAVAEMLLRSTLPGRPAWVAVGGARFFAATASRFRAAGSPRCPADAELTLAISAAAQRDAEARAEACFARAYAASRDWRSIR